MYVKLCATSMSVDGWIGLDVIVPLMLTTENVGHCFSRRNC